MTLSVSKTTKPTKTAEFVIRYVRKDRLWRVTHHHRYPNYSFDHPIYTGVNWRYCMWLATGDPAYIEAFDQVVYRAMRHYCGVRDAA
jgi:hypothetical protein